MQQYVSTTMDTIRLDQLPKQHTPIDELIVRSLHCDLFRVEVLLGDRYFLVTDREDKALSFRSQLAAKKPFKGMGVNKATLVHNSCYDEMIGGPAEASNELKVSIQIPDLDYS